MSYLEKLLEGVEVEWRALGRLAELVRGNGLQKKDFTETGVPAIHYGQIYTYYGLSTTKTKSFVTPELAKSLRKVDPGNIVITNTSENLEDVGKAVLYLGKEQAVTGGHATIIKPSQQLLGKYFVYFTQTESFASQKLKFAKGTKVIDVSATDMSKILIPIPCPDDPEKSLAIQNEIVRILDKFTELTAALTAELTARKQQYGYYRERLLSFSEGEVAWKALGEVVYMRAGQHISSEEIADNSALEHVYPCFGGNGIRGYVKKKSHSGNHLLIGRQGALCGNVQRFDGEFYATEHAVVVTASDELNINFAFHLLTLMNLNQYASKSAQPGLAVGKLETLEIPIPSLSEQARIVSILDKFDTLTTSISEGLPKEIELRKQQYAYYRDMLLGFNGKGKMES